MQVFSFERSAVGRRLSLQTTQLLPRSPRAILAQAHGVVERFGTVDRVRERFLAYQFQKGNAEAFLKLVQLFEKHLLYYLRRFERDPDLALDLLQEVWLSAWKTRDSLRSPDAFRTWLYRIAHGKVVSAIRKEVRHQRCDKSLSHPETLETGSVGDALESAESVHFALSKLSPSHREVLTLRFLEEMSVPEIAFIVGCPEGTVKSRLHHASQQVTAILRGENHAEE